MSELLDLDNAFKTFCLYPEQRAVLDAAIDELRSLREAVKIPVDIEAMWKRLSSAFDFDARRDALSWFMRLTREIEELRSQLASQGGLYDHAKAHMAGQRAQLAAARKLVRVAGHQGFAYLREHPAWDAICREVKACEAAGLGEEEGQAHG